MGTEETLRRRRDIPDEAIEELVAKAAKLQDDAVLAADRMASSQDIEAVASELNIAPEFVEQAIESWRSEQSQLASHGPQSRIAKRRKKTMKIVTGLALTTCAVAVGSVALGLTVFGLKGLLAVGAVGVLGLGFLIWLIS